MSEATPLKSAPVYIGHDSTHDPDAQARAMIERLSGTIGRIEAMLQRHNDRAVDRAALANVIANAGTQVTAVGDDGQVHQIRLHRTHVERITSAVMRYLGKE